MSRNRRFLTTYFKYAPQFVTDAKEADSFLWKCINHCGYTAFNTDDMKFMIDCGFKLNLLDSENHSPAWQQVNALRRVYARLHFIKIFIDHGSRLDIVINNRSILFHMAMLRTEIVMYETLDAVPIRGLTDYYIDKFEDVTLRKVMKSVIAYIQKYSSVDAYSKYQEKLSAADALLRMLIAGKVDQELLNKHKKAYSHNKVLGMLFHSKEAQQSLHREYRENAEVREVPKKR